MITILDGGMGRELEQSGAPFRQPEWSALALMEAPEKVRAAHDRFIAAGADVITTNSYACIPFHIGQERFAEKGRDLIGLAGLLARDAADAVKDERTVQVAGCIPPLFGSYNPDWFDTDAADEILTPFIEEQDMFVDLWLIETVSSVAEALYIIGALQKTGKPVWVAFTLTDNQKGAGSAPVLLRSGRPLTEALDAVKEKNIEAVLFNCSLPETITPAISIAANKLESGLKLGAYANAFEDKIETGHVCNEVITELRDDLTNDPAPYLAFARQWAQQGATIIGGCCGIGPAHIKALTELRDD